MTKIVLNKCYGGFSLSKKAIKMLKDLGVNNPMDNEEFGIETNEINDHLYRADPKLLRVVEELGTKGASGECAELRIVDIPEFVEETGWEVNECDGFETVHETHWSA